ncbi:1-deoxy-D-xylulose-5-phosphate synthase [Acetivibrio ethanolgignens]|uniref:1-deoxy-D-xylulose-5-phosphate synthase n=1 Tax=Acetivibrio ethanolgignens TaxID=290052 RepID=A0A0V8QFJ2_9FIRM|nr:1-deoxy-D-xylulose-5-phosphate synthase [Acetivibrio ethanolgignens]KSV59314.1 1-deoxy-D-xylulose-5-phosphate synthase [Acetivibrio ethanolgignens]
MPNILDKIEKANDIKNIPPEELEQLAWEIRRFLLEHVSKTGGHLASNLGCVELTIALHRCLTFPEDKLVWDVGHQAYTHKILTGRKDGFDTLRQFEGMSGFPKTKESDCDAFVVGHSSTSISAALGMAAARDMKGEKNKVFAVIGDGAMSGGMAFEALNNAARLKSNLVIVINDNNMSITENVGGMANYLSNIRTDEGYQHLKDGVESALRSVPKIGDRLADRIKRSKDSLKRLVVPGMLFEDMGLTYLGPIDGHNIEQMVRTFHNAKRMNEAVVVHVITKKGKGYAHAEKNPSLYHGVDPFEVKNGVAKQGKKETYTKIFGDICVRMAKDNPKIAVVCAAMPSGTGLMEYRREFPHRYFDVGIAEEHAVTFAAGLAASGMRPVVAIYSTFLQRAYDQILHDVCIDKLPVTFALDRGGLVGSDGETHQGVFDLSYLSNIPNLVVMAPKNKDELVDMMYFSVAYDGPTAVRYPRGEAYEGLKEFNQRIALGKSEVIYEGQEIALLAVGSMVETAEKVSDKLRLVGVNPTLINVRFVKPMDEELLLSLADRHRILVTMEENVKNGGFGEHVADFLLEQKRTENEFINVSLPDAFIEHGSVETLKKKFGLDADSIVERIMSRR